MFRRENPDPIAEPHIGNTIDATPLWPKDKRMNIKETALYADLEVVWGRVITTTIKVHRVLKFITFCPPAVRLIGRKPPLLFSLHPDLFLLDEFDRAVIL